MFAERFAPDLIQAHARRTSRLEVLTHAIALALGGRPGEQLTERIARRSGCDVRVIGVDDFAWLKGQRYGTIIRDLECRCTIDLLPDREGGTVADWLAKHPGIEIVCRDRGSGFREGAAKGAPSPADLRPLASACQSALKVGSGALLVKPCRNAACRHASA